MVMIAMTERFNIVDLLETLSIADGDECKYYQNSNDDFIKLCDLLNELSDGSEQLKEQLSEQGTRIDFLKDENKHMRDLVNENKQLKQFQEQVASVIESKMGDNICNNYKMEVLKEIWNELELDEVWFE